MRLILLRRNTRAHFCPQTRAMPQLRNLAVAWAGAGGPGDAGRSEEDWWRVGGGVGFEARVKSAGNPTGRGSVILDGGRHWG